MKRYADTCERAIGNSQKPFCKLRNLDRSISNETAAMLSQTIGNVKQSNRDLLIEYSGVIEESSKRFQVVSIAVIFFLVILLIFCMAR